MSAYMYMVSTVLFEVTFRTHICSLFSAKVVIAFVCIIVDKQLIVGGCDQYTYIALSHSVSESTIYSSQCLSAHSLFYKLNWHLTRNKEGNGKGMCLSLHCLMHRQGAMCMGLAGHFKTMNIHEFVSFYYYLLWLLALVRIYVHIVVGVLYEKVSKVYPQFASPTV